mmetsp:Transcript_61940/g.113656  ORF Transcript_61940/g.113656 Transcript_61940/m.113656 type:complete len:89 (+) Transcript_61940:200-466(+)
MTMRTWTVGMGAEVGTDAGMGMGAEEAHGLMTLEVGMVKAATGVEDTMGLVPTAMDMGTEMGTVAEDTQGLMATAMDIPAEDTHGLMA